MEQTSDRSTATSPPDELPDTALFWRWVGRSVRPYAGWVLVGVGALAIILGYLGVANQALVAKQLPYLISGGIFGLALLALGTFYLMTEELRRDSGRLDRLERMVAELHFTLLARADAPDQEAVAAAYRAIDLDASASNGKGHAHAAGEPDRAGADPAGAAEVLVALPESQRFHRASCRMVQRKPDAARVSVREIARRQLQPCTMCDPVMELKA